MKYLSVDEEREGGEDNKHNTSRRVIDWVYGEGNIFFPSTFLLIMMPGEGF